MQLSQWLAFVLISLHYQLSRPSTHAPSPLRPRPHLASRLVALIKRTHPFNVAAISGAAFWVGNSAIIVGRDYGLAYWLRDLLSSLLARLSLAEAPLRSEAWEEMATFHIFGMLGNHMLFRTYEWIALREADHAALTVREAARKPVGPPTLKAPPGSPPRKPVGPPEHEEAPASPWRSWWVEETPASPWRSWWREESPTEVGSSMGSSDPSASSDSEGHASEAGSEGDEVPQDVEDEEWLTVCRAHLGGERIAWLGALLVEERRQQQSRQHLD